MEAANSVFHIIYVPHRIV